MNEDKLLSMAKIDGFLLFSSENLRDVNFDYFSGFRKPTYSFFLASKKKMLITSSIDYDRALNESNLNVIRFKDYDYKLKRILRENFKGKKLGIIASSLPLSIVKTLRGYKLVDVSEIASEIRAVKNKKEIKLIKKACKITNKGIKYFENNLSINLTEKQLAVLLEDYLKKKGAESLSFPTVLTSGKRSALIHPYPECSNRKISKGLGLIDFGVGYKGYCSDVTIPFIIGKLTDRQKKIVNAVKTAYENSIETLKEGKCAHEVYEAAEKIINNNGFELKHSVGHGLGLEVHDFPSLSPKPKNKAEMKKWKPIKLKTGMVVTLEPGVYEQNEGGCRLENDILIAKKPVVLTKSKFLEI